MVHQRLGAVVPGADRDVVLVQYGAEVVRMHPVKRETDDTGAVLWPEQRHIVAAAQRIAQRQAKPATDKKR